MTPVTVVEIDIPYCSLTYGTSPCTASIPTTGSKRCFNFLRTCQDRDNFTETVKTVRFCTPTDSSFTNNGTPVAVIPTIESLSVTPTVLNPGADIGQRESVKVSFKDHQHSDAGLDKYVSTRGYEPFDQGTFWGKMRARVPSFEGFSFRLKRGVDGDDLADMDTWHYVVDAITGQSDGVSLTAKDLLTLTDKKKAQAPRISNGVLSADLSNVATTFTLSPSGIGAAEYLGVGKVAIGGKEICSYTRSGETFTIVRGLHGTEAQAHDEGDRVQIVLEYDGETPADIVAHLLINYVPNFDYSSININDWNSEVGNYVNNLYSAVIAEPTPVVDLLNELIEQVGLVFWWDSATNMPILRSLRPVSAQQRTYSEEVISNLDIKEQPAKRVSEVWTYYGMRNPLEPIDEASNYKAAIATVDELSEDYKSPAIKRIYSRWISETNRPAASRLNAMILSRFRDAPRIFSFDLPPDFESPPSLASGFALEAWEIQDDEGAATEASAQVISIERRDDKLIYDAQESFFYEQEDLEGTRFVYIDDNAYNVNLRTLYDAIYSPPEDGDVIQCVISSGVIVGSNNSTPAFSVGTWAEAVTLELVVNGSILGRGGAGGSTAYEFDYEGLLTYVGPGDGQTGGTAIYTREAIDVTNNGIIAGGGGGGGGGASGSGGGGAGYAGGEPGPWFGNAGTPTAGGAGEGGGGAGGGPGLVGSSGSDGSIGGDPGSAVDGESYITYSLTGTITGPRVN